MPYDHDYVCMMKQPVLCELCNKSYAIGVMKKHKQSKMHIENAKNHGVPSSLRGRRCGRTRGVGG